MIIFPLVQLQMMKIDSWIRLVKLRYGCIVIRDIKMTHFQVLFSRWAIYKFSSRWFGCIEHAYLGNRLRSSIILFKVVFSFRWVITFTLFLYNDTRLNITSNWIWISTHRLLLLLNKTSPIEEISKALLISTILRLPTKWCCSRGRKPC